MELHKAFIGFSLHNQIPKKFHDKKIATGKWGCGGFKGNPQVKFII